mmetsp:Transcript_21548/g.49849  ORF Transcript_21548/g.49849 Transcript_21548/m.49849 type:complete len:238 (-) Transcript_21548:312-1025(-)
MSRTPYAVHASVTSLRPSRQCFLFAASASSSRRNSLRNSASSGVFSSRSSCLSILSIGIGTEVRALFRNRSERSCVSPWRASGSLGPSWLPSNPSSVNPAVPLSELAMAAAPWLPSRLYPRSKCVSDASAFDPSATASLEAPTGPILFTARRSSPRRDFERSDSATRTTSASSISWCVRSRVAVSVSSSAALSSIAMAAWRRSRLFFNSLLTPRVTSFEKSSSTDHSEIVLPNAGGA